MAGININPALVSNASGTFYVGSSGYVQGTALNDPAIRNELVSGVVNPSDGPFWGGMGITESLPSATQDISLGSVLTLATSESNLTGFTVFDQASAMINSPQSPVPLAPSSGAINFYRLGSGARIAVACSSAVAAALLGGAVNVAVYWDYTNQVLLTSPGGTAIPVKVIGADATGNSQIVSYSSSTGFATWNYSGYTAVIQI